MKTQVVLGSLFGDEGKGACTQYLVKQAKNDGLNPIVIRFSGGAQSAHTIKQGYKTHICSSFGAGVLEGVPTLYIGGYFDPISYVNECEALEEMGITIPDTYLSQNVQIVTPYDVFANRDSEREKTDGTCGKGIYQAFKRGKTCLSIGYFEMRDLDFISSVMANYYGCNHLFNSMYAEAINSPYMKKVYFINSIPPVNCAIIEGSQGMLLDMDFGFYPNVTPSRTGLLGLEFAIEEVREFFDISMENAEVYFCCRSYLTRHGNGYEPTPASLITSIKPNIYETNIDNEWQGNFKIGIFDMKLLNESFMRHNVDNMIRKFNLKPHLVMSCIDCIGPHWEYVNPIGYKTWIENSPNIMEDIESLMRLNINMITKDWKFLFFTNPYSNPFER